MTTEKKDAVDVGSEGIPEPIDSLPPRVDQPDVKISANDYVRGLGPLFSKLPRELRDQIFSYLIAIGRTGFMRVSRAMNREGMALVYKKGAYRMRCGFMAGSFSNYMAARCLNKKIAEKIQNFDIVFKIADFQERSDGNRLAFMDYLSVLMESADPGGICNILFEAHDDVGWDVIRYHINFFRGATDFSRVVLRVDANPWNLIVKHSLTKARKDKLNGYMKVDLKFRNEIFAMARERLEPRLGKSFTASDARGPYLIFRPQEKGKDT